MPLKTLWQKYEIPLTLVSAAIAIVIFIYTTFPTRTELNAHAEAEHARIAEIKSDTKDGFDAIDVRMADQQRTLNTILLEVRKK